VSLFARPFRIAAVLGALAVLGLALTVGRIKRGPDPSSGVFALPGLDQPVEILYDSMGVPHVWAESVEDALCVLGTSFTHSERPFEKP